MDMMIRDEQHDASGFVSIAAGIGDKQRFRKPVMRVGKYASGGRIHDVTGRTLDNWVTQFGRMSDAGVRVPMPNTHEKAGDPDFNRGYVDGMYRDGDELVMTCELIGDDALAASKRSDVSVFSVPEFSDGQGTGYPNAITHVALVTHPLVSDLGEFIPLAASLRRTGETTMKWDGLQTALGIDALTDETAEGLIVASVNGFKEKAEKGTTALKASNDALAAAKGELVTLKASLPAQADPPSPALVALAAESRGTKLGALVASQKITPACRDLLFTAFVGTAENSNAPLVAALSVADVKLPMAEFDALCAALDANIPVAFGEKSGAQSLTTLEPDKGDSETNNVLLRSADALAKSEA